MSHNRSFIYMTIDELAVKKEFDKYRMNILQEPVLQPIKNYGLKGLDETLYAIAHKIVPGLRKNKIRYYHDQIIKTEAEMINRPNEEVSEEYTKILSVAPNPATFNVLGTERENLRRQRITKMKSDGEELYPSETFKHTQERIKDAAYAPLDRLGATGEFIKKNILWITTAATLIGVAYTGNNWLKQSKIYDGVAQEYVNSHEVSSYTLPLKRDIAEELIYCGINLTHTPEVNISLGDDGEITIPEKLSMPQVGRVNILNMANILQKNIPDKRVRSFISVSEKDKAKIIADKNAALSNFDIAQALLAPHTDGSESYTAEFTLAATGNSYVQDAVETLESYMDQRIVEKENEAYSRLALWKWLSIGGLAAGVILGGSAYKTSRNRKWRNRYY